MIATLRGFGFRFQDRLNGKDVIVVEDLLSDERHVVIVVLIVQEVEEIVAFRSSRRLEPWRITLSSLVP